MLPCCSLANFKELLFETLKCAISRKISLSLTFLSEKPEEVPVTEPVEVSEPVPSSVPVPEPVPEPVPVPVSNAINQPTPETRREDVPVGANRVKTGTKPVIVKGEAIPVPLENPAIKIEVEKYEQIINDEVGSIPDTDEPYERIPAECFTESFDCDQDPTNKCCAFIE